MLFRVCGSCVTADMQFNFSWTVKYRKKQRHQNDDVSLLHAASVKLSIHTIHWQLPVCYLLCHVWHYRGLCRVVYSSWPNFKSELEWQQVSWRRSLDQTATVWHPQIPTGSRPTRAKKPKVSEVRRGGDGGCQAGCQADSREPDQKPKWTCL